MSSQHNSYAQRRKRLQAEMNGRTTVIAAGRAPSRNFVANTYPERSSSHFLYFLGQNIPGAVLVMKEAGSTVYLPRPADDDALWHGPAPTLATRQQALGIQTAYLDELLPSMLRDAVAIPVMDSATNLQLTALLGRNLALRAGVISDQDERLARAIVSLRMVHDEQALIDLRRATECTVRAHEAGLEAIYSGVREYEIWAAMQKVLTEKGMSAAYQPIVTVHGEVLHAHSHSNQMQDGDLLLVDVGAETENGWAGDVTRTWPVSGSFSSTQKEVHQIVLNAQKEAISQVRPGIRFRDVHLAAARAIASGLRDVGILEGNVDDLVDSDAYALFFPHGVGHLLGLDVHDMEDLGDRPGYAVGQERSQRFGLGYLRLDRTLEPGMVVTIEPGFYQVPSILKNAEHLIGRKAPINYDVLSHFSDVRGIRIEDDILVTHGDPENLTGHLIYEPRTN